MGRPPKIESVTAVQPQPETPSEQTALLSGFPNLDAVEQAAPESTTAPEAEAPRVRRPRKPRADKGQPRAVEAAPDPMLDPRVRKFMASAIGDDIGAIGVIPYDVAATVLSDPRLALTEEERQHWSDGLYALAAIAGWNISTTRGMLIVLFAMQARFAGKRAAAYMIEHGHMPDWAAQLVGELDKEEKPQ